MIDWLKTGVPNLNKKPTSENEVLKPHTIHNGWNTDTVYYSPQDLNKGGIVQTYQDKKGTKPGKRIPASELR